MGKDKDNGKDKEADDDDEDDDNEGDEDDVDEATSVTGEELVNHIATNNNTRTLIDHNLLSQESKESFHILKRLHVH